jgi:hypothetical protein
MEKTTHHITEYRENQDINFEGITSFKVQNHGESTVDINTVPVYPGQTLKVVEEDGTYCDFNLKAVFTEATKLPKFRAIYKQLDTEAGQEDNKPELVYTATLYNYEVGDIVEFSHNMAGHTILTRSFDGGLTFLPENDIDLGFVPANEIVRYDRGGYLTTTAIQFRNNDLEVNSEVFMVNQPDLEPLIIETAFLRYPGPYIDFETDYPNLEFTPNRNARLKVLFLDYFGGSVEVASSINVIGGVGNSILMESTDYSKFGVRFQDMVSGQLIDIDFWSFTIRDSITGEIIEGSEYDGRPANKIVEYNNNPE